MFANDEALIERAHLLLQASMHRVLSHSNQRTEVVECLQRTSRAIESSRAVICECDYRLVGFGIGPAPPGAATPLVRSFDSQKFMRHGLAFGVSLL